MSSLDYIRFVKYMSSSYHVLLNVFPLQAYTEAAKQTYMAWHKLFESSVKSM